MSTKSLGILLAVTLIAILAALWLAREERHGIPAQGERVLPELKERINQVSEVTVATTTGTITVARAGDAWVVKEKDGYHAAMEKVRSVVIGLAELTILEPTTRNPEHHAKLGLQDVSTEGSDATRVTLKDAEGATLAAVLIGHRQPSRADSTRDEVYVRKMDEAQTWLATGRVRPETAPLGWIEKQILNIDTQRVRQVRVTHPDGHTVLLRKAQPGDPDFQLLGVPKNTELRSQFSVNNVVDTLAHLTLDDARRRGDVSLPAKGRVTASLETFDGLRIVLRMAERDERHLATLSAEFDPALVQQPASRGGEESGTSAAREDQGETASDGPSPAVKTPEEVAREAARVNDRLREWVFILPGFRADTLATRREALIKT